MNQRITAIVENGVLRPTAPLSLAEGTRVELTIIATNGEPKSPKSKRTPAELLSEIAALPMEPGPEFSGRDHDQILYGEDGAR